MSELGPIPGEGSTLSMEPRPDPSDLYARAAEAWGEGRHEAAAELLEALVESDPGHVVALNTLGMIALNLGDGRRAAAWIERAAAAEPGSAPIWFNLFQAL